MQDRFKGMSENIVGRIDEMGTRIEDLEKSIEELVKESNNVDEADPEPVEALRQWLKKRNKEGKD